MAYHPPAPPRPPAPPPPPPPPPPGPQYGTVAVIGPQYCMPYNVDVVVAQKALSVSQGDYTVTDTNGGIMFVVKGKIMTIRDRRILVDTAGNPIVTMKQKLMSAHDRWQVFRGDSSEEKDVLFTVKKSSLLQVKPKFDVFLATNNSQEKTCDFKMEGSFSKRSCTIYLGDSNNIVAQMHKKHKLGNMILGKGTFGVTVYPNVDYAFIVSLLVVLDSIDHWSKSSSSSGGGDGDDDDLLELLDLLN